MTWWHALEARTRSQARAEIAAVARLRSLLILAVDGLGEEEWCRFFETGGGRIEYVSFDRAVRLAQAAAQLPSRLLSDTNHQHGDFSEVRSPDSGAEISRDEMVKLFALLDPQARGVVDEP